MLKTMNEEGFLLDQAKHIPLPKHLGISRRETLAMDTREVVHVVMLS